MPYMLEKGPSFSVTESVFENLHRRIDVLIGMRDEVDPDLLPTLDSTTLDFHDPSTGALQDHTARIKHQNDDWYGRKLVGGVYQQAPFNAVSNPNTGYWLNWYGDAQGIVREVYLRAIEVSLGIKHIQKGDEGFEEQNKAGWIEANLTRIWPIEIFARCPSPWFEGWVTWQGHDRATEADPPSRDGHVTVHLHTPANKGSMVLKSPVRNPPPVPLEDYQDELSAPPYLDPVGDRGMWVVAHDQQEIVPALDQLLGLIAGSQGSWTVPWFGGRVHSHGKIRVVRPKETNGGVLAGGRPY
jgi:hypothetical protein